VARQLQEKFKLKYVSITLRESLSASANKCLVWSLMENNSVPAASIILITLSIASAVAMRFPQVSFMVF
jgi:hypothetical protein